MSETPPQIGEGTPTGLSRGQQVASNFLAALTMMVHQPFNEGLNTSPTIALPAPVPQKEVKLSEGGVSITRRAFLKASAAIAALLGLPSLLTACGPPQFEVRQPAGPVGTIIVETPQPDNKEYIITSETHSAAAGFFAALTRSNPYIFDYISSPTQRDIFASILLDNQIAAAGGFAKLQEELIKSGNTIGLSLCSDSRVCLGGVFPVRFPNIIDSTLPVDIVKEMQRALAIPIRRIAAQPAVFQPGVNHSFFIPHQIADCVPSGCGALGGIEALANSENGILTLKKHGVSELTIANIKELIMQGAVADPTEWAKTGARLQAEMNAAANYQATGIKTRHYTAYAVYGHTDKSIGEVTEVIDDLGNSYPIQRFPLLNGYKQYLETMKIASVESLLKQSPKIINMNASRIFSGQQLLGDIAKMEGNVFISEGNRIGKALSAQEALSIIAGGDYAVGALENSGIILLTADTAKDMATLRTALLTRGIKDGSILKFLNEDGGIIIEMLPNAKTGAFVGTPNILTGATLEADLEMLKASRVGALAKTENNFITKSLRAKIERDFKLGLIDNDKYMYGLNIVDKIGAFIKIFRIGLNIFSNALLIADVVKWLEHDAIGINPIYTVPTAKGHIFWNSDYGPLVPNTMNTDEMFDLMRKHWGANPNLVRGDLDRIIVNQSELAEAYEGALTGYIKYGPGTLDSEEPWKSMEHAERLIQLEIPNYNGDLNLKLFTTLIIRPNDPELDGKNITFNLKDPNQTMMLVDSTTSEPLLGNESGSYIIPAYDPQNSHVVYFFEVTSVPNNRNFEFRFIGLMPTDK